MAKIFQGGARTYFLPEKQQKRHYFLKKVKKHTFLWPAKAGQGGQEPLLALTCGRPCVKVFLVQFSRYRKCYRTWSFVDISDDDNLVTLDPEL
jgi:hypothetical protein